MERHGEYFYATKGRHFVLSEKGATEHATYRQYKAGEPIESGYGDDYHAHVYDVENGYVIEVDDPSWVTLPGYRAVYDVYKNGEKYVLNAGNPIIYHDKEMAEYAVEEYNNHPWNINANRKAYVIDAVYEGKAPKPCREVNGKRIFNKDYWAYNRPIGSLVEEDIAMDLANCVPPTTFRSDFIQCGEPYGSKVEGTTYATFVKVGNGIWEWRGNCLRGQREENGTLISYV
ncbi:MAG: hypothetical protein K6F00_11155 [Lachnospiraceae bacterium]|nr:hypothetical protein [Lachnospiraceae bacterium]